MTRQETAVESAPPPATPSLGESRYLNASGGGITRPMALYPPFEDFPFGGTAFLDEEHDTGLARRPARLIYQTEGTVGRVSIGVHATDCIGATIDLSRR